MSGVGGSAVRGVLRTTVTTVLLAALVITPIAVAAALPEQSAVQPSAVSSDGSSATSSEPAVPLPEFKVGPVVILQPLEAKRVRDPHAGQPIRVRVPSLGMNAPVVGIYDAGGILTPPSDPNVLGWWVPGAVPGAATGSALITGHTVHAGEAPMNNLDTVSLGSLVLVRTTHGTVRYRVTLVRIYRKASLAKNAAQVFDQSVPGRLVLITCDDWDGVKYLSNAVVMAVPIRTG